MSIAIGVVLFLCLATAEDETYFLWGLVCIITGFLLNKGFRAWVTKLLFPRFGKHHSNESNQAHEYFDIGTKIANRDALRRDFESLKQQPIYNHWKRAQYARQNGRCAYCGRKIALYSRNTHADHVRPLWEGGTNDFSNLVLSCRNCNMKKGAAYMEGVTKKPGNLKKTIYEK